MTKRGRILGVSAVVSTWVGLSFAGCAVDGTSGNEGELGDPAVGVAEEAVLTCPSLTTKTVSEAGDCHLVADLSWEQQKCASYCGNYCAPSLTQACKDNFSAGSHTHRIFCSCGPLFDCTDGVMAGGETGVDCGGPCDPCGAGQGCAAASDCQSGVCLAGVCAAPTCNDAVQNGAETDVDCGGACSGCAAGEGCAVASDCQDGICVAGLCAAATCSDGLQNGGELGVDCGGPCTSCGHLVINEVDYDQVSTDFDEYIEILNPTSITLSLANVSLVLVNGANNTTYSVISLASAGSLAPGQYLVVASSTVAVAPGAKVVLFGAASGNVQNGSPDGIALVDGSTGTLIDAFSYEGSMAAANVTGVGVVSLDEGIPTSFIDTNASVRTLIRKPNGQDTNDASVDWAQSTTLTPGSANP